MLLLGRKIGEEIIIDNNVLLKVLNIQDDIVILGVEILNGKCSPIAIENKGVYHKIHSYYIFKMKYKELVKIDLITNLVILSVERLRPSFVNLGFIANKQVTIDRRERVENGQSVA